MKETDPKHRWFRFSIRDLLWLTALVALAVGWWLDHREQVSRYQALNGSAKFEVYPITVADPNAVLAVLQTMLAGEPVRLAVDTKSNFIVAQASPAQHAMIRALVDKLEGKSPPVTASSPNSMPNLVRNTTPAVGNLQRPPTHDQIEQMPIVPPGDPH